MGEVGVLMANSEVLVGRGGSEVTSEEYYNII